MKNDVAARPAYRKVIADLRTCEERYGGLLKSIKATDDSRLASAITILKSEVRQRRRLEVQLLKAVEAERERIGQDLHDDLCQRLGGMALLTASLARRISRKDEELGRELAQIPGLINETIESCRDLARGLHPITLASAGLPAALKELATRMPIGIKLRWPHGERIPLEPSTALHLYRIAEEAVANAAKHAEAKSITIELEVLEGRPVLVISDDGKGFGKQLKTKGMGLRNMKYRANVIAAELTIEGHPGGGTRVRCKLPACRGKT
jgi:signal transduction histidine kinase